MQHRATTRPGRRLGVLLAVALLAACGGDDDDAAADPETTDETAESPADDEGGDEGGDDGDSGGDGGGIQIDDLDDIPDDCLRIMGEYLRAIEPVVSGIDWENATMQDLESLDTDIATPSDELDEEMAAAGCDEIEFGTDDDRGLELAIELAEREAPDVVPFLEFITSFAAAFDDTGDGGTSASGDVPQDCDEALDYIRGLMASTDSALDLPVSELTDMYSVMASIQTNCSVNEAAELFDDPAFAEWAGG